MTGFPSRWLTALPIYNEARHVNPVLDEVRGMDMTSPGIVAQESAVTGGVWMAGPEVS